MGTERLINETDFEYHKRLIYGKLVDKTLADVDYTELAELAYGQPYSSDVARRMFYGSKNTLDLIDSEVLSNLTVDDYTGELNAKVVELQKERQKFYDQRTAFNKVVRDQAREEELVQLIEDAVKEANLPTLNYSPNKIKASDNDLLVSLNDIHYGAVIDNYWNKYDSDICAEMMCDYIDHIINVAETHNSQNCIIWCNGDQISGNIHRSIQVTNKENVIEQITGVSELIAEFISELSKHFETVTFVSVAGNHSRLNPNKDEALASERLDDLVEWYLAARLQNFENVIIGGGKKIDNTMYTIDVRGKTYLGIHGDYDGSASKIQSLQTMVNKPLYAVLSGHLHHGKIDEVQGIKTIMAGSFQGMDDYCVQKRIYGHPEQTICVCDENGVRCIYQVNL